MTVETFAYDTPGDLTRLRPAHLELCSLLGDDPIAICAAAQQLVIQPAQAGAAGVPEERLDERNLRSEAAIVEVLASLDPAGLHVARPPDKRVVGTCRHFAVLAVALLRARGIAARARCGFATYFQPGKAVDHWVIEHRRSIAASWTRTDVEILGGAQVPDAAELRAGEFLTGGEAWSRYRAERVDPTTFGVWGTEHAWGIGEIRGNAIRDLAALCKVEMLPWDEWGRMSDSYHGRSGPDFDALIDRIADACGDDDPARIRRTYACEDLAVPSAMIA